VRVNAVAKDIMDITPWGQLESDLDAHGFATLEGLLTAVQCDSMSRLYESHAGFRSRVVMSRHGFGQGEYRYFAYPLPPLLAGLRESLYSRLVSTANRWNAALRIDQRFPLRHADYLAVCHACGQTQPTPLLLQYGAGDYNRLHQDLYGEHVFPLQVAVLLDEPGRDFTGGEFVLTEQRPRMQSKVEVVPLRQGDAVVFAVHHRPVESSRGASRVSMRHGVSRLHSGRRRTLGIIFHDAE
jgi:hypothetical protein